MLLSKTYQHVFYALPHSVGMNETSQHNEHNDGNIEFQNYCASQTLRHIKHIHVMSICTFEVPFSSPADQKNECMYVCKGWAIKTGPCTVTFNDLLCYPYSLTLY
jgi:hypothetical protein